MVNLQELEKEIDALLASETPESLNNWLKNQENLNLESYLGQGQIIARKTVSCIVKFANDYANVIMTCDNNKAEDTSYAMAA